MRDPGRHENDGAGPHRILAAGVDLVPRAPQDQRQLVELMMMARHKGLMLDDPEPHGSPTRNQLIRRPREISVVGFHGRIVQ